ncbi:MAG: ribose 5-phosphate isomerase A [Gaiellaceae bacterium]
MTGDVEREKRLAAEAAAELVEDGMAVGLGTGTTAGHFLVVLAERELSLRCVATSPATERAALELGLTVEPFDGHETLPRLDIAVDGADQISPERWVVKGGGGAHTREKIVAAAAARFVVVASSDKLVDRIRPPVPLELLRFGLRATLDRLEHAELRAAPPTPDGGVLADWRGRVDDPTELARLLSETPGVVEHGLFPPGLVSDVLVGHGGAVQHISS